MVLEVQLRLHVGGEGDLLQESALQVPQAGARNIGQDLAELRGAQRLVVPHLLS